MKLGPSELHLEVKTTAKAGYRISRKLLDQLRREAGYSRVPSLIIQFVSEDGRLLDSWVLLPTTQLTNKKVRPILQAGGRHVHTA